MSDKMKAAALSATKGLSRVQAECAAANATRNVNAYGQKEEGPSRWQEKKELKTQMYLKSTEKQATLNQKKCQKCQQIGHWTYECQKPEKTKLDIKALMSHDLDKTEIKNNENKKKKEKGSKGRKKKRKETRSSSSSDSDSDNEDDRRRKRKRHSRR